MKLIDPRKLAPALLLAALLVLRAGAAPDRPPNLAGYYDLWLLSVDHLIADAERRRFLVLASDVEREVFIRRFWRARAAADGSNAALERWRRHFEVARLRFRDLASDRAQSLMLAGSPARVVGFGGCGGPVRQLEVWAYSPEQAGFLTDGELADDFYLVFASPSARQAGYFRRWSPADGLTSLLTSTPGRREPASIDELFALGVTRPCVPSTMSELRTVRAALDGAWSGDELRRRLAPPPPDSAWLEDLAAELRERPARLPAAPVELRLAGRFTWYVIVHGRVRVPASEIRRNAEGLLFDRLEIVGDIWQAGRLVQPFRVVHHVAGPVPPGDTVTLDFYRRLRPGKYDLSLRVEDGDGLALRREDRKLEVTWMKEDAVPPAGFRRGFSDLLRPVVGMLTTFPSVHLLASGDELMAGDVEVEAVTTGGPIARLDFLLNGESAGSDQNPPYAVRLELGGSPEPQILEALAYDPAGLEIARDRAELNVGSPRFDVRLLEPQRGRPSGRVRLAVAVPLDETLVRVELYLDDQVFATLTAPPWSHPLPERIAGGEVYVRAVAFLASGEKAEDLVVIDERPVEEIDVRLVELYTSVVDANGRPVPGLREEELRVLEDGEEQALVRFDTVENLPVNVILLMDVSQSMRDRIEIATVSAQRFFAKVLTEKDQASFLIFNDDVRLLVPFTNDVRRLAHGASGLRAWGTTRLYDSLIYTFHYFGGQEGKKALVLLSDGEDVDSEFEFEQVLEHALRSGVAAYAIGLDLQHPETRSNLARLASETGGRFFTIATATELDRVYRLIELDLRSQYLLVYRPPAAASPRFRRVEVEVLREGLKARTLNGYYP
jgi:VWFA-related protein